MESPHSFRQDAWNLMELMPPVEPFVVDLVPMELMPPVLSLEEDLAPMVFIPPVVSPVVDLVPQFRRVVKGAYKTPLRCYGYTISLTSYDYQQLQSVVDRRLGFRLSKDEGSKQLIQELFTSAVPLLASTALEEDSRFIPVLDSIITAPLSIGTYCMLNLMLAKMASVALEIFAAGAAKQSDEDAN